LNGSPQALCFTVKDLDSENRSARLDAHYFDPSYFEMIDNLELTGKKNGMLFLKLGRLLKQSKTNLTGGATPRGAVYLNEGIRFVRSHNVKENRIDFGKAVFIEPRIHEGQLRRSKLKPRDVLLTITGTWGPTGNYGVAAVVPDTVGEANINQHSVKIELDETIIDPYYFAQFINSELGRTQIFRAVTGSTRSALSYPTIKALMILVPKDISFQKEIASKVNRIYMSAYETLEQRKKLLMSIDKIIINNMGIKLPNEYAKTIFIADINNSKRLDVLSNSPYLIELRECVKKMPHDKLEKIVTFPKSEAPPFEDYYRLVDLRNVEEKTGRIKIKEVDHLGSSKIMLRKNNICINCLNPEKAKTIFVNDELDGCAASNEFTPIEILDDSVEQEYLVAVLRSKVVIDQWKYQITGSTPSRERISENELRQTLIPKPDRKTQKIIGQNVMDIIQRLIRLEQEYHRELENAKQLFLQETTHGVYSHRDSS